MAIGPVQVLVLGLEHPDYSEQRTEHERGARETRAASLVERITERITGCLEVRLRDAQELRMRSNAVTS